MIDSAKYRILLVDDEEGIRIVLGTLLIKEGYQVDVASCHGDALLLAQNSPYDLVFIDIMLAGECGIDLLSDIKALSPATEVVMFTGSPEIKTAADAVRLGAYDYILKPVQHKDLLLICRKALSEKRIKDEQERHRICLEAIFSTVSDAIILVDKKGCLEHFNAAAGNVCGYSSDLLGSAVDKIDFGCGGKCRAALLETLHSNTPRELRRFECRMPGGAVRIVSIKTTPLVAGENMVSGVVAVIRDETSMVELERSLKKRGQFHKIIGVSEPMQRIYSLVEALADVPTTVLIHGESGTGKELVASALHYTGGRAKGPFVKVNCSALSESLLESELFGHVRGAFTGAITNKIGRFQKAHGGTLFLDEIADISPTVQKRLLRVLQESEFEQVGDSTPIKVDVRIIAATNQNLSEMVSQGTFRQDLYYRLNVVSLSLPSLKERKADIGLLVTHFLTKYNDRLKRNIYGVTTDVMDLFLLYPWPGNVRELEHAMEHAMVLCRSDLISLENLPQELLVAMPGSIKRASVTAMPPHNNLTLEEALSMANGNKTRAARLLGISRRTVYRQLGE